MNNITVTLPLAQFEKMKDDAARRDVRNFIGTRYKNLESDDFDVTINQEAVKRMFGKPVTGYSEDLSDILMENLNMRLVLKNISETPVPKGVRPGDQTLHDIIDKAGDAIKGGGFSNES